MLALVLLLTWNEGELLVLPGDNVLTYPCYSFSIYFLLLGGDA